MKFLKNLFFVMAVTFCAVSCLNDEPTYSGSYIADVSFEPMASFGADSLYFDQQYGLGVAWTDLAFCHKLDEDKTEFLGGFILSQLKGKGSGNDGYRVNSGVGYRNSATYAVFRMNPDESKMPENDILFYASSIGTCAMAECYVNNTKEVVEAVKSTFVDGDRLVIRMTGYLDEKAAASQEFVLAEYTEQRDSVVTTWTQFKLDKLNDVDYIDIEFVTNREDLPKSVCFDNVKANISYSY